MTEEAEKILVGTQLAQEKLAEVQFVVENEGFQDQDIYEEGEFDDFGDEAVDVEFRALEEYHYEYLVTEIDLNEMGDLVGNMQSMMGGAGGGEDGGQAAAAAGAAPSLPFSPELIGEMLNPFIREVKVRVWWGEDGEAAEEAGDEIVVTTHMINPHGNMLGNLPLGGGGLRRWRSGPGGGPGSKPGALKPGPAILLGGVEWRRRSSAAAAVPAAVRGAVACGGANPFGGRLLNGARNAGA
jgi:hypothetical protein